MLKFNSIQTLFSDLAPKCYYSSGRTRYYQRERHNILRWQQSSEEMEKMLLRCTLYCRTRSWAGDYHRREYPPFLNIGLIHSGETAIRSGNRCYLAKPGDLFFLAPETKYELLTPRCCERSAFLISGPVLESILRKWEGTRSPVFFFFFAAVPERWFERMNVLLPESFRLQVCREISGLCFELLQYLSCPAREPALPAILQNVLEKIKQDYGKSIEMKSLADSSGISVSTLTRLFKQHLGKTPHQYLIGLRMRQAARLLEQNSFSVKEIAGLVGYENALNFSTEFRKFFGRSPRSWRTTDNIRKIPDVI